MTYYMWGGSSGFERLQLFKKRTTVSSCEKSIGYSQVWWTVHISLRCLTPVSRSRWRLDVVSTARVRVVLTSSRVGPYPRPGWGLSVGAGQKCTPRSYTAAAVGRQLRVKGPCVTKMKDLMQLRDSFAFGSWTDIHGHSYCRAGGGAGGLSCIFFPYNLR